MGYGMSQIVSIMYSLDKMIIDLNSFIIENQGKLDLKIYEIISVKARLENLKDNLQDELTDYELRLARYASNCEADNTL